MKANKVMKIAFMSLEELEQRTLRALETQIPDIQEKNGLYYDSVKSFREFMTLQKLELLAVISSKKPRSVYELAKLVDRDIAPVQRDCHFLVGNGFIRLDGPKGKRGARVPRLRFDYDTLLIELPELSYELKFKAS